MPRAQHDQIAGDYSCSADDRSSKFHPPRMPCPALCCLGLTVLKFDSISQCVQPQTWSTVDRPNETVLHRPSDIRLEATYTDVIIEHPTLIVHRAPILYHRPAAVVSTGRRPHPARRRRPRPPESDPPNRPLKPRRRNALRIADGRTIAEAKSRLKMRRKPCARHSPKAVVVPRGGASPSPPAGEVVDVLENERNEYVVDEAKLDPKRLYVEAVYLPEQ